METTIFAEYMISLSLKGSRLMTIYLRSLGRLNTPDWTMPLRVLLAQGENAVLVKKDLSDAFRRIAIAQYE